MDVATCRRLEAYPKFTTIPAARRYVRFLDKQAVTRGVSSALSQRAAAEGTDLTATLDGIGSQAQVERDARRLQAVCTGYGVKG